jgi:cobalt-zinc-cadmium efflux system protein
LNHQHLPSSINRKYLWWAFWINFVFLIIEVIGGLFTGSLALLSDAGHMLTDVGALGLAIIVSILAERPPDERRTYGYLKTEILGAFINGTTLVAICGFIIWEAIQRFQHPQPILAIPMLIVAVLGLVANLISAYMVKRGKSGDINLQAAYLHLIFDALGSAGVILSGLIIWIWGVYWIDTISSLLIVILILVGTRKMILDSVKMLIDSVPEYLNYQQIRDSLLNLDHVLDVHDLHIWSIGQNEPALSAHLILSKDCTDKDHWDQCLKFTQDMLANNFQITHTTLQIEPHDFPDDKNCH